MRQYSNLTRQALSDDMHANVNKAASIIADMHKTLSYGRRRDDKVTVVTEEQKARIESNRGKHVYGSSHPKYTGNV